METTSIETKPIDTLVAVAEAKKDETEPIEAEVIPVVVPVPVQDFDAVTESSITGTKRKPIDIENDIEESSSEEESEEESESDSPVPSHKRVKWNPSDDDIIEASDQEELEEESDDNETTKEYNEMKQVIHYHEKQKVNIKTTMLYELSVNKTRCCDVNQQIINLIKKYDSNNELRQELLLLGANVEQIIHNETFMKRKMEKY